MQITFTLHLNTLKKKTHSSEQKNDEQVAMRENRFKLYS